MIGVTFFGLIFTRCFMWSAAGSPSACGGADRLPFLMRRIAHRDFFDVDAAEAACRSR